MVELRARLARRCEDESGGGSVVRRAIETAVGSVAGAGPLVDAKAVRSAHDEDLVWCAQSVQRAINMLEGARSSLAAEVVRRQLHARRGEASGAETLVNATAVGGALARRIEREAQALDAQPAVAEVLGRGEITSDQAAAVAAADVPDDVRNDLCKQARNQTADQTRQTVRSAEAAWRRESEAQRHARQRAARSASMWIDPNDGMWHLRAKFDALTGDAINRLLISAIERNWRSDKDLPESKRRSVQQRAADALAWAAHLGRRPRRGSCGRRWCDSERRRAQRRDAAGWCDSRRRPAHRGDAAGWCDSRRRPAHRNCAAGCCGGRWCSRCGACVPWCSRCEVCVPWCSRCGVCVPWCSRCEVCSP